MSFRENEIIILIGAGCSADAEIPTSKKMIEELERLRESKLDWKKYIELYHLVKSAALYSDGLVGKYENNFDIERLVNILGELEKKENSILFPFIGGWNPRLLEIAGYDFKIIQEFKIKILGQLKSWVQLEDYNKANYYSRFFDFQSEYNFPLRLFSLNYDLCLEKNKPEGKNLERGFGEDRRWDWRRFQTREEYEPEIYFYKMHGSIDWERNKSEGNILKAVDRIPESPDLIFGTDYKMQYIDPYLFYTYELRKYSLETKIIVTIGYSFRDEHINGILTQALRNNPERKIVVVNRSANEIVNHFAPMNEIGKQIKPFDKTAKEFLEEFSISMLEQIQNE